MLVDRIPLDCGILFRRQGAWTVYDGETDAPQAAASNSCCPAVPTRTDYSLSQELGSALSPFSSSCQGDFSMGIGKETKTSVKDKVTHSLWSLYGGPGVEAQLDNT